MVCNYRKNDQQKSRNLPGPDKVFVYFTIFYDYLVQINRIWKKYSWICSLKYNRHSKLLFQWEFRSEFVKNSGRILKPSDISDWRSFVAESLQVFQWKKSVSSSILSKFFKNLIWILIWKAAFFIELVVELKSAATFTLEAQTSYCLL